MSGDSEQTDCGEQILMPGVQARALARTVAVPDASPAHAPRHAETDDHRAVRRGRPQPA